MTFPQDAGSSSRFALTLMISFFVKIMMMPKKGSNSLISSIFCQNHNYANNKALLEKDPEHRASLWHLKEHEWILQEVKIRKQSANDNVFAFYNRIVMTCLKCPCEASYSRRSIKSWPRWTRVNINYMMSSLALNQSFAPQPTTGINVYLIFPKSRHGFT